MNTMNLLRRCTLLLVGTVLLAVPPQWSGARSSIYGSGRGSFPSAETWSASLKRMVAPFPKARATAVWIVGALSERGCRLEFPRPEKVAGKLKDIAFMDTDRHEPFLSRFDQEGVDVYLQVEPGFADVDTLLELVLARYKHHPCVKGFGIDVEWYRGITEDSGVPVKDAEAIRWERKVKAQGKDYRLFLKHYDAKWLCEKHRGDIVFVDDSQQFTGVESFVDEMSAFATHFAPNPVLFQIGYPKDRPWWKAFPDPVAELGKRLGERVHQPWGLVWVDFTLREVTPPPSHP